MAINVPGLSGYIAAQEQTRQQEAGQLQKLSTLMQLKSQMKAQQDEQELRSMLSQSGGNVETVIQGALRAGRPEIAAKLAPLLEAQRRAMQKPDPRVLAPGGRLVSPTGEVIAEAPFKPEKPDKPPTEVQLVDFYNNLPATDPRKPIIKQMIDAKTRPPADPYGKPLSSAEIAHWKNPEGKSPPPGSTMRDLIVGGYKFVSTAESNKASEAAGAYATLSRLDELTNKLWDPKDTGEGLGWRSQRKMEWTKQRLTQSNTDLASFEAFSRGTLAPLIRAVGEKGNLATEDIERALLLIPNTGQGQDLPDTPKVARAKMKQLREWFDRAQGKVPNAPATPSQGWTPEKEQRYQELLRKRSGS